MIGTLKKDPTVKGNPGGPSGDESKEGSRSGNDNIDGNDDGSGSGGSGSGSSNAKPVDFANVANNYIPAINEVKRSLGEAKKARDRTINANNKVASRQKLQAKRDAAADWYTMMQKQQNAYKQSRDALGGTYGSHTNSMNDLYRRYDDIQDTNLINTEISNNNKINQDTYAKNMDAVNNYYDALNSARGYITNYLTQYASDYNNLLDEGDKSKMYTYKKGTNGKVKGTGLNRKAIKKALGLNPNKDILSGYTSNPLPKLKDDRYWLHRKSYGGRQQIRTGQKNAYR